MEQYLHHSQQNYYPLQPPLSSQSTNLTEDAPSDELVNDLLDSFKSSENISFSREQLSNDPLFMSILNAIKVPLSNVNVNNE